MIWMGGNSHLFGDHDQSMQSVGSRIDALHGGLVVLEMKDCFFLMRDL